MTPLGLYLARRSVNKAEVARRTGISKSRLSQKKAWPLQGVIFYQ